MNSIKIKSKKFLAIGLVLMAISILSTATGALIITSNTLNFTPQAKPTLTISSNSTSTPYVDDTIQITAFLTPPTTGVPVTAYANGGIITTVNTNNGQAVFTYKILNTTPVAITATANIP